VYSGSISRVKDDNRKLKILTEQVQDAREVHKTVRFLSVLKLVSHNTHIYKTNTHTFALFTSSRSPPPKDHE
jgi:hypothetical protein